MRVYPKGTRIDSSNFNPLVGWKHGVQMVAFNMQGHERPLWLMQGLFRSNGGCGYVKKTEFLMNPEAHHEIFNPNNKLPVKQTLKVKVYMGERWDLNFHHTHFDFYSLPNFYVKIGIAGVNDAFSEQFLLDNPLSGHTNEINVVDLEDGVGTDQKMAQESEWDKLTSLNTLAKQLSLIAPASNSG